MAVLPVVPPTTPDMAPAAAISPTPAVETVTVLAVASDVIAAGAVKTPNVAPATAPLSVEIPTARQLMS